MSRNKRKTNPKEEKLVRLQEELVRTSEAQRLAAIILECQNVKHYCKEAIKLYVDIRALAKRVEKVALSEQKKRARGK